MDFRKEITYLVELAQLSDMMAWHADRWNEARDGWLRRQTELAQTFGRPRPEGMEAVTDHVAASLPLQRDMWLALEGFLTAWARASLMLFPAVSRSRKVAHARATARATHLRAVLNVSEDDTVGDRRLRNHWMHFDEHLDTALDSGERVTPQRWVPPGGSTMGVTMRAIVPGANCIVFRDEDVYDLSDLFRSAANLGERVRSAMETAGERHSEELSAPNPLEY